MTALAILVITSLTWVRETGQMNWNLMNIPSQHLPFYFNNNPELKSQCNEDASCPYKAELNKQSCWGYEVNCPESHRLSQPTCPESSRGWTNTKEEQLNTFWTSADFGYVKERRKELKTICRPQQKDGSSLECAKYFRFCRGKNIYFDFQHADFMKHTNRYREDLFKPGDVGGNCIVDYPALKAEGEHKSPLQSWYAELEYFSGKSNESTAEKKCDVVIGLPALVIKLDATVNLYHHFCDFVNAYVSQHVNNSFNQDVQIIIWDTSDYPQGDFFVDTWKAFTRHPLININQFDGKKVCFSDVVFSLLARMRYGLYYNTPLINGCFGSSMIKAFNEHLIHRLNIPQHGPLKTKIRITFQVRKTQYRNILNKEELMNALKTDGEFEVRMEEYSWNTPFLQQVEISHNSDILIGIHGAGLTHLLFQPDWAVVIELYNCGDGVCYYDLSRLRGIEYMTWEKKDKLIQEDEGHHPTLGAHEKFTNYAFDVIEFMRLIHKAADYVRTHPQFIAARHARVAMETVHDEL